MQPPYSWTIDEPACTLWAYSSSQTKSCQPPLSSFPTRYIIIAGCAEARIGSRSFTFALFMSAVLLSGVLAVPISKAPTIARLCDIAMSINSEAPRPLAYSRWVRAHLDH